MTDTAAAEASTPGSRSLPARLVGVLFGPRAAYADVAARPRWLGAFAVLYLVLAAAATGFIATDVGRNAFVDLQTTQTEALTGRPMSQQQLDRLETVSKYLVYATPILQLIGLGVASVLIAGACFAVFNALLGGDALFKQVYAIVVHSGVILASLALFTTPLAFARQTLSSATNLGVFFPFLDDASFAARLLGAIDLVNLWWMISLSIGLGVLYRRRTGPIAATFIGVYVVIGIAIAAFKTAMSGAS